MKKGQRFFFFFKRKAAYVFGLGLVGSELCIGDSSWVGTDFFFVSFSLEVVRSVGDASGDPALIHI